MKSCSDCEIKSKCLTKIKITIQLIGDPDINRAVLKEGITVRQYIDGLANWCNRFKIKVK